MKSRLMWCQPGPGSMGTARPGCHRRTYAPAGSLGSAFAGLRRGAGRNRIAAGANRKERPAIPALPRPCPVPPPRAVLLAGRTLSPSGAPRTASLSSAASAVPGRRLPGGVAAVPGASLLARSAPVPSLCAGIRSGGWRSSLAVVAGGGSRGSPLLAAVRPPARGRVPARPLAGTMRTGGRACGAPAHSVLKMY